jgi:hypothetical protein
MESAKAKMDAKYISKTPYNRCFFYIIKAIFADLSSKLLNKGNKVKHFFYRYGHKKAELDADFTPVEKYSEKFTKTPKPKTYKLY